MKFLSLLLTLIMCAFILAGCNTKGGLPVNEISMSLKNLAPETVSWVTLNVSSVETYFGIPDDSIKSFSGYISSSEERFDMIAVFEYEDKQTRKAVLEAISLLTKQMSDNYKLANISEVSKITSPNIAELGNTIIFCVMDGQSKVANYLENELDAKIIS